MFTIGKFAEAGGVGVETIRFYQRKGLLKVPEAVGAARHYDGESLKRLHFIRSAQVAGFTLEEIKELIALDSTQDRKRARFLAQSRIEALNAKIAELEYARDALKRLAKECASGDEGPCPILSAFASTCTHGTVGLVSSRTGNRCDEEPSQG